MIKREITPLLLELSKQFRSITINGPRQAGKTSLARSVFAKHAYVTLEDLDTRRSALDDPRGFLSRNPAPAILDEIQEAPDIMSYLQGILDNSQAKCQYILTGSQNFIISEKISQSLVGRTALATLLPLSYKEILNFDSKITVEQAILRGGYPAVYSESINHTNFYKSYKSLYLERDVRAIRQIVSFISFEKFITLLAGRVGQILNYENLSNDLGINDKTVNDWLSVLETSFITFRLSPYYRKLTRRIVKRPKVYFYDTGLLCSLLGITTEAELFSHPAWGSIYENFVIVEKLKSFHNRGANTEMYFIRDSQDNEIDLLYREGTSWHGVEIKSSQTYSSDFSKSLNNLSLLFSDLAFTKTVVYRGVAQKNLEVDYINTKDYVIG
jgi:uncharacterized protein